MFFVKENSSHMRGFFITKVGLAMEKLLRAALTGSSILHVSDICDK